MKSIVFLVSVATTDAAYKAVESEGKLFYVIDDFELERSNTPITKHHNLDVKIAASQILPLYSPLIDSDRFHNHGCYCSRFHPENPSNYNKRPLDSLDMICRDWIHMKTCLRHDENCFASTEDLTYEARHEFLADTKFDSQSGSWNISFIPDMNCDGNSENLCLYDNCRTDRFFLEKIFEYFKASQGKPDIINVYGRKAYDNPCLEDFKPAKIEHTIVHDFGKIKSGGSDFNLKKSGSTPKKENSNTEISEAAANTKTKMRSNSNVPSSSLTNPRPSETIEAPSKITRAQKSVSTPQKENSSPQISEAAATTKSKIMSNSYVPPSSLTDSRPIETIEAPSKITTAQKNYEKLIDEKSEESTKQESVFGTDFQRNGGKVDATYDSYDYEHYDGFYYDEYETSMKTAPVEQQVIRSTSYARGRMISDTTQAPVVDTTTNQQIPTSSSHNEQCLRLRKITGL